MWAAWLSLMVSSLPLAALAAESTAVRLSYRAGAGEGCPEEQAFRDLVAARLGRDPFRADGALGVEARFIARAGRLIGSVRAVEASGAVVGERDIEARPGECAAVAASMAIAISILLDPLALVSPPGVEPREPPPPEASPIPVEPPPPEPLGLAAAHDEAPPDHPSVALALHGGITGGGGLTPSATFGPTVGAGVRIDSLWLALEGRLDATAPFLGSPVEVAVLTAGPAACIGLRPWLGCAAVHLGAYQGRRTDLTGTRFRTTFFSVADIRAGRRWRLGPRTRLRVLAELRAPLVRTMLTTGEATIWRAPALAGGLRLELAAVL